MGAWLSSGFKNGYYRNVWQGNADSRIEAILDGVYQYQEALKGEETRLFDKNPIYSIFFVGKEERYTPSIDIYEIIESLQEDAYCACGKTGEMSLNCLKEDSMKPAIKELEDRLNVVICSWMRKYGVYPILYTINNIESVDAETYLSNPKAYDYQ